MSLISQILDQLPERAALLKASPKALPNFLQQKVDLMIGEDKANGTSLNSPVYAEVMDFLASGPTLEQIADFDISRLIQHRVEELLDKNCETGPTDQEWSEMYAHRRINRIMTLLKTRANILLRERT